MLYQPVRCPRHPTLSPCRTKEHGTKPRTSLQTEPLRLSSKNVSPSRILQMFGPIRADLGTWLPVGAQHQSVAMSALKSTALPPLNSIWHLTAISTCFRHVENKVDSPGHESAPELAAEARSGQTNQNGLPNGQIFKSSFNFIAVPSSNHVREVIMTI